MKKFRSPPDWTPEQRHSAYVDRSGGPDACWPWTGYCTKDGYGRFGINISMVYAHRVAYEFAFGPFPKHLCVLHRCDNPACQNPRHLRTGNHADNVADMMAKGRHRSPSGERHSQAKLTAAQAAAIRADTRSLSAIARDYGIVRSTAGKIKNGKLWRERA